MTSESDEVQDVAGTGEVVTEEYYIGEGAYDQLYLSLGEFAVQYESLVSAMQSALVIILNKAGLQRLELADVLLAKRGAAEVGDMFISMIATSHGPHTAPVSVIMANLNRRIQDLQSRRNDLLHRNWFLALRSPDSPGGFRTFSLKLRNTTGGVHVGLLEMGQQEIAAPTQEALALREIVIQLLTNIGGDRPLQNGLGLTDRGTVIRQEVAEVFGATPPSR